MGIVDYRYVDEPGLDSVSLERIKEIELQTTIDSLEVSALDSTIAETIAGVWVFSNGINAGVNINVNGTVTANGGGSKEWNCMSYFLGG